MKYQIIFVMMFVACANAEDVTGRHCFTYGEKVSLQQARRINKTLAVRDAIESSRLYVESVSTIKDSAIKSDIIKMLSNGSIKELEIVSHSEEDKTVCDVVSGKIDPEPIYRAIGRVEKMEFEK
jgi:hypothetical protein